MRKRLILRLWTACSLAECKEKKYRLAIFESGEQDLVENTKDLLIHNRGLEKTDDTPKVMGLG